MRSPVADLRGSAHDSSVPGPAPHPLLTCSAVRVVRGRRSVLRDVELALRAGELVQLAGANGSGKTSLLRVLAGTARERAGRVDRCAPCAYVPEKVGLAPSLRPGEWLDAMRTVRREAPRDWAAEIADAGLDPAILGLPSRALSKGMLQRVALVEARGAGRILLLDEPFAGLDGPGRDWLASLLVGHGRGGGATLFTDHSGAAAGRAAPSATLLLRDGRCVPGPAPPELVRIEAVDPSGTRCVRTVAPQESDAVLARMLSEGCNIIEVGR